MGTGTATPPVPAGADEGDALSPSMLFSRGPLPWGSDFTAYLLVVALIAVAGIVAFSLMRGSTPGRARAWLPVVAGSVAVVVSYFSLAPITGPYDSVRYATPILIAIWPMVGLAFISQSTWIGKHVLRREASASRLSVVVFTIVALQVLVLTMFSEMLSARVSHAINYQSVASFPFDDEYANNIRRSTGEIGRAFVRRAQEKTQRDTTILAWIGTPFHLDFARNKILSLSVWGVVSPWFDFPVDADIQRVHEYLTTRKIRYLIWEYDFWGRFVDSLYERYTRSSR